MQSLADQAPLYDAAGARAVDAFAIDASGIPGIDLMRAAAAAAERVARGRFPRARRVLIVAGPGNNGGDGCEV
ncbi:MAG: NAD(P)H-hydrate epimerase, partial [Gaiellales bacterium]